MAARIKVAELFVPVIGDAQPFVDELNAGQAAAQNFGDKVTSALSVAGKVGLASLAAGAGAALGGVTLLGTRLKKLAIHAAPLEGIGQTFSTMSQRFGVSLDDMRKAVAGTVDDFELMQQANIALTGLTGELGREFGQKLPDLLLTARAAARSTGRSVEYMYSSLVNGIKRASPRLIDNTGLVIELGVANKKMAKDIGTTVEQLSAEQKTLATLNAVTEKGVEMAQQFGLTSLTAQEQIQRLESTMTNIKDEIGLAFNPAVKAAASGLNELAHQALGPLSGILERSVAPAVTLVIEEVMKLGQVGVRAGMRFFASVTQSLQGTAEAALSYGINISTQLATGIIRGAVAALVAAMNFVSNLLANWLAPGSPPKVAPDLPEWGAAAMNEYLKGFTNANFDILEGVQGHLKRSLDALVTAGDMGEDVADQVFAGLSVRLIKAIDNFNKTGKVSQRLFADLSQSAGIFGDKLAELARRQFAFAKATDEVRRAEAALRKSRKAEEAAQSRLNQEIEKYNDMLRAGASGKALSAQRKRVFAARDEMELAQDQIKEAEAQKKAAEDRINPLNDQVRVQERLLDQLLKFTKAQEEAAKAGAGAGAGAGGAGGGGGGAGINLPTLDMGGGLAFPEPNFSAVGEEFETAKEEIREKMLALFDPVIKAWNNRIQPALQRLGKSWQRFTKTLSDAWQKWGVPVVNWLKQMIPPSLLENIGIVAGNVLVLATAFGALAVVAGTVSAVLSFIASSPLLLLIVALGVLKTAWEQNWGDIQGVTENAATAVQSFVVDKLWPALQRFGAWVGTTFTTAWNGLVAAWDWVKNAGISLWAWLSGPFWSTLKSIGNTVNTFFVNSWERLVNTWETVKSAGAAVGQFFSNLWETIKSVGTWITNTFSPGWRTAANILGTVFGGAIKVVGTVLSNWWGNLKKIVAWVSGTFGPGWSAAANLLTAVVGLAVKVVAQAFRNWWASLQDIVAWIVATWTPGWQTATNFIKTVLKVTIGAVRQVFINWWESLKKIVNFVSNDMMPMLNDLWAHIKDKLSPVTETLTGLWEDLKGGLDKVWNSIKENVLPWFKDLGDEAENGLGKSLTWLKDNVLGPLKTAFDNVKGAVQNVISKVESFTQKIKNVTIPSWWKRDSPSEFEMVFLMANKHLNRLTTRELPRLKREMRSLDTFDLASAARSPSMGMGVRNATGYLGTHNEFNMEVHTRATTATVRRDFEVMRQRVPSST